MNKKLPSRWVAGDPEYDAWAKEAAREMRLHLIWRRVVSVAASLVIGLLLAAPLLMQVLQCLAFKECK